MEVWSVLVAGSPGISLCCSPLNLQIKSMTNTVTSKDADSGCSKVVLHCLTESWRLSLLSQPSACVKHIKNIVRFLQIERTPRARFLAYRRSQCSPPLGKHALRVCSRLASYIINLSVRNEESFVQHIADLRQIGKP